MIQIYFIHSFPYSFPLSQNIKYSSLSYTGGSCCLSIPYMLLLVFSHSVVSNSATPWTAAHHTPLSFTISQSLPKLMSIESVMPSNHLTLCGPLLLLPSILPSIRVFSNELALRIRWPKYWSFSISPSHEHSVLISFRIDWFDPLALLGTFESSPAPQFESINFFSIQPS